MTTAAVRRNTLVLSAEAIGLAITILGIGASGVAAFTSLSSKVDAQTRLIEPLEKGELASTIARIDERTATMAKRMDRMSDRLERLEARSIARTDPGEGK